MSGILAMIAAPGSGPRLSDRTLVGAASEAAPAIIIRFTTSGILQIQERPALLTSYSPEWAGTVEVPPGTGAKWDVRLTVVSGNLDPFLGDGGAQQDTWYNLGSGTIQYHTSPAPVGDASGVWRFEIRDAATGVIHTSADYDITAND